MRAITLALLLGACGGDPDWPGTYRVTIECTDGSCSGTGCLTIVYREDVDTYTATTWGGDFAERVSRPMAEAGVGPDDDCGLGGCPIPGWNETDGLRAATLRQLELGDDGFTATAEVYDVDFNVGAGTFVAVRTESCE
jgi:hypothetical protein